MGNYSEILGVVHLLEDALIDGLLHDALLPPLVAATACVGVLATLVELLDTGLQVALV